MPPKDCARAQSKNVGLMDSSKALWKALCLSVQEYRLPLMESHSAFSVVPDHFYLLPQMHLIGVPTWFLSSSHPFPAKHLHPSLMVGSKMLSDFSKLCIRLVITSSLWLAGSKYLGWITSETKKNIRMRYYLMYFCFPKGLFFKKKSIVLYVM